VFLAPSADGFKGGGTKADDARFDGFLRGNWATKRRGGQFFVASKIWKKMGNLLPFLLTRKGRKNCKRGKSGFGIIFGISIWEIIKRKEKERPFYDITIEGNVC
jgi:hypothetical protein